MCKKKLNDKDQEFVDDTMKLVEQNKELEIALSNLDHKPKENFHGWCPDCQTELDVKANKIKYCKKCKKDVLSPAQSMAQEVLDYIEGNCPHTHKKCKYWQEISKDDYECVLPDFTPKGKDPICPHSKRREY